MEIPESSYLCISNDVISESLRSHSQVGVDSLPMTEESIVINRINLLEED
jgi:hypothetical protein